jgi:hypothetical protein
MSQLSVSVTEAVGLVSLVGEGEEAQLDKPRSDRDRGLQSGLRYKSPRRNKHPKLPPSCYRKNRSRRIAEVGLEAVADSETVEEAMGLEAVGLEEEEEAAVLVAEEEVGHSA